MDLTIEYSLILRSFVTTGASRMRAVAMMLRSAGSAWNGGGRKTDRTKMALSTGTKLRNGSASHLAIQSRTYIVNFSLPLAASSATSKALIEET